jgi:hypothetical protein
MDNVTRYRSIEAFCRHRALIDVGEADAWLKKASAFSRMAAAEGKLETLAQPNEEKSRHSGELA